MKDSTFNSLEKFFDNYDIKKPKYNQASDVTDVEKSINGIFKEKFSTILNKVNIYVEENIDKTEFIIGKYEPKNSFNWLKEQKFVPNLIFAHEGHVEIFANKDVIKNLTFYTEELSRAYSKFRRNCLLSLNKLKKYDSYNLKYKSFGFPIRLEENMRSAFCLLIKHHKEILFNKKGIYVPYAYLEMWYKIFTKLEEDFKDNKNPGLEYYITFCRKMESMNNEGEKSNDSN